MASGSGEELHGHEDEDYGDAATMEAVRQLRAGYAWADVVSFEPASAAGRAVRVRGAAQAVRAVGRRVAILVLRQGAATVQCVVSGGDGGMARFAAGLSRESVVDVAGVVSLPREPVRGTTQQVLDVLTLSIPSQCSFATDHACSRPHVVIGEQLVEIQVEKLHCISRAVPNLPISVAAAARSKEDVARAKAVSSWLQILGNFFLQFPATTCMMKFTANMRVPHVSTGRGAACSCRAGQAAGLPGDRPPHRRQPGHLPRPMPSRKRKL